MKLATLKNQSNPRDGQLIIVSQDLSKATLAAPLADTLQQALDNWLAIAPELTALYQALNQDEKKLNSFAFNPKDCMSPLPRAYQWADGSAYVNHVELVRKARGAEMPESFWHDPLMYQGGSDAFLGPYDDIVAIDTEHGIDFEAEIAVITNDVPMAVGRSQAQSHICLFMLVNDVSLRNLIPNELAKGFGFFQAKPSSSFSPVAVTVDELGSTWQDYKLHLPLKVYLNEQLFGSPNAGTDMTFDFLDLICHAAKTRPLNAGTIIGSGTVSNKDRSKGSCCIAEKRMLETIEFGKAQTNFMQFGDRIRIEMHDNQGQNLFGSIDQIVTQYRSKG